MTNSTARRLITGSTPGSARQTGQTWVLGAASAYAVEQAQNIFEAVLELAVDLDPDDRLVALQHGAETLRRGGHAAIATPAVARYIPYRATVSHATASSDLPGGEPHAGSARGAAGWRR